MIAGVLLACTLIAIDGDTLRCGRERIRLLGIDAPEMPGHCRRGRRCVKGDPVASKAALAAAIARGPALIERRGRDHYGRTLARVRVNGVDLSGYLVQSGMAVRVARWE
ncbi:thermonuclease family protein [Sphingomonas panni]